MSAVDTRIQDALGRAYEALAHVQGSTSDGIRDANVKALAAALGTIQGVIRGGDEEPGPAEPPGNAPVPLVFRLRDGMVGDFARGVNPDAEIGDVILHMFKSGHDGERVETFSEAVMACTIDDLAVLDLAHDSESTLAGETQRQMERIRWRLIAARWLDEKLAEARQEGEVAQ